MNTTAQNANHRRFSFRLLTTLLWLALPAISAIYLLSWNQLPQRVAAHFDLAGRANGWMPRRWALAFFLLVGSSLAALSAWLGSRVRKPDPTAWATLLLFYVLAGTLVWEEVQLIAYNTSGHPITAAPVALASTAAALVVVVALSTRRGSPLPTANEMAEESHASLFFALLILFLAGFDIDLLMTAPNLGLRLTLSLVAALMLAAASMAWAGFRYRFSTAGVEIRMLGFRLRSIPAADIKTYAAAPWSFAGGYGIRGVGERRAYVWGNRGVRITTSNEEVFLGHDHPERILRDLDRIVARGAASAGRENGLE